MKWMLKWLVGLGAGLLFTGSASAVPFNDLPTPFESFGSSSYAAPQAADVLHHHGADYVPKVKKAKKRKPGPPVATGSGSCEQPISQVSSSKSGKGRHKESKSHSNPKPRADKWGKSSATTSSVTAGDCPPSTSSGVGTSPNNPDPSPPGDALSDPPGALAVNDDNDNDGEGEPDVVDEMELGEFDPLPLSSGGINNDVGGGPYLGNDGTPPGFGDPFGPAAFAPMSVLDLPGGDITTAGVETNGIPEPGSLALLGLGFAGLAATRRRKLN